MDGLTMALHISCDAKGCTSIERVNYQGDIPVGWARIEMTCEMSVNDLPKPKTPPILYRDRRFADRLDVPDVVAEKVPIRRHFIICSHNGLTEVEVDAGVDEHLLGMLPGVGIAGS